jgi:hypothetical protein
MSVNCQTARARVSARGFFCVVQAFCQARVLIFLFPTSTFLPLRLNQIKLLAQNQYLIAQDGGGFEVEVADGIGHLLFFFADEAFGVALHTFGVDDNKIADGLVVVATHLFSYVADMLDDGLWRDAVRSIVVDLDGAAAVGFADGVFHGAGHVVGIQDDATGGVPSGAADGLDEGCFRAQKAFFVSVEDADEGYFGQIKAFTKQVHTNKNVVFPFSKISQDIYALDRFYVAVEVRRFYLLFFKEFTQRSSAIFLVKVVASTRSPFAITFSDSAMKSKICPL